MCCEFPEHFRAITTVWGNGIIRRTLGGCTALLARLD